MLAGRSVPLSVAICIDGAKTASAEWRGRCASTAETRQTHANCGHLGSSAHVSSQLEPRPPPD